MKGKDIPPFPTYVLAMKEVQSVMSSKPHKKMIDKNARMVAFAAISFATRRGKATGRMYWNDD